MKRSLKHSIAALLLAFVMLLSMTSCLAPAVPSTPETPATPETPNTPETPTTPETPNTPDPENPSEHVCSFGEWIVIKGATTTEDGLRERKCACGEAEQEVIEASGKEYYIQYRNLKTADYPAETGYNSKEGLLTLPAPEANGYVFIGWYTASIGGDLIDYIPEGSKKNYILYAHWDLVTYDITYKNVPDNTNVTSYDIEDKIKLETPEWSGLVFTHWTDEDGNVYKPDQNITALPEKMTGDLTLTANWKVLRNIATPAAPGAELFHAFSGEDGMLYFFYDLGTIEHVVLDNIDPNLYYKAEGMPISLTLSKTVTVSEETAKLISDTISKSISSTSTWESAYTSAQTHSENWNAEIGAGLDVGIGGGYEGGVNIGNDKLGASLKGFFNWSVSAHIEGSYNWGSEDTWSSEWNQSQSYSDTVSEDQSQTVNSSLAYKEEITSEITENFDISAELPSGYYAYVHAGNIRVIGIVSYEIATGYMYLNTYSRLDNMHSMIMYYPTVNDMNNPAVEGLDFTVPEEEIVQMVENSYYVQYDANGGTGTMTKTMHSVGKASKLAKNQFTKEGAIFAGWELVTSEGTRILLDEQSVTDLGGALQTVKLKAMWTSTEPIWTVKESGTNYYIKPAAYMGFDTGNEICAKYNNGKLESGIDGDTKIVVTEEKFHTYVYWHWATNNTTTGDLWMGDYKNELLPDGKTGIYFVAFESTQNYEKAQTDSLLYYCDYSSTAGSWWWRRFEVYAQTYTVYENTNPLS